ncbi:hypothetical protein TNIN_292941 [Trichonephila inaurata madagascariensis]|uniref:Uncharacterized protein n=1 Tax=Trichonephila inaurata madagascariensis TaxID=2747483 RepID=A0A8X6YF65_9ARAC|nr:hypothetical protein TNIN_292941 [Trichonephila inaurata madagascariensis]
MFALVPVIALVENAVTPNSPEQNQMAKQVSPKTPDSHVDGGPVAIVTDAFLEGEGRWVNQKIGGGKKSRDQLSRTPDITRGEGKQEKQRS